MPPEAPVTRYLPGSRSGKRGSWGYGSVDVHAQDGSVALTAAGDALDDLHDVMLETVLLLEKPLHAGQLA